MTKRSLYSPEEKYHVISEVIDGGHSVNSIAKRYSLSEERLKLRLKELEARILASNRCFIVIMGFNTSLMTINHSTSVAQI